MRNVALLAPIKSCARAGTSRAAREPDTTDGGPDLLIKRDDCTGFAGGGNKGRKLEFVIAEAVATRADAVVTHGGVRDAIYAGQKMAGLLGCIAEGRFGPDVFLHRRFDRPVRVSLDDYGAELPTLSPAFAESA